MVRARPSQVDADGQTDAGDRLLELDGVVVEDLADDEEDGAGLPDEELAAYVAEAFPRTERADEAAEAAERGRAARRAACRRRQAAVARLIEEVAPRRRRDPPRLHRRPTADRDADTAPVVPTCSRTTVADAAVRRAASGRRRHRLRRLRPSTGRPHGCAVHTGRRRGGRPARPGAQARGRAPVGGVRREDGQMSVSSTPAAERADRRPPTAATRNEVVLVGRVPAAPEERELPSGDRLVSLAPGRRRREPGAPRHRRACGRPTVDTLDCVAWTASARRAALGLRPDDVVEVARCAATAVLACRCGGRQPLRGGGQQRATGQPPCSATARSAVRRDAPSSRTDAVAAAAAAGRRPPRPSAPVAGRASAVGGVPVVADEQARAPAWG